MPTDANRRQPLTHHFADETFEWLRNMRICRGAQAGVWEDLLARQGQVTTERLHGSEQLRHRIHDCMQELLSGCTFCIAEELAK